MRHCSKLFVLIAILFCLACKDQTKETIETPRIVNIINFIRQTEPRLDEYTDEVLYQTVVEQVKHLNQYKLPGTFLLQYDALINPKYQLLLKNDVYPGTEVGAWWEITQPHVEDAGLVWRGRYSWDWHADVGFATGYTPKEREMLVDVYMEKFKSIFGKYPASVGSWFIDAHSLAYMHDKYGIVASCNCKDQIGTDGYTLWGGYWNQAYYPSRKNGYMPAQTKECQIDVPIFRMLGSDPIYQYDTGLGGMVQGVISLEPVYKKGGGDRKWVEWFFDVMFNDPSLNFNYTQAGQENSFTWNVMKKGLEIQIPLLDSLRKQKKIRIETLEESGKWFKSKFDVTPPTAFSALTDIENQGHKTVWFNSRYYRANLLWKNKTFRFRDIHLFDERLQSNYLDRAGTSTQCIYTTLPFVDGFVWSTKNDIAGLRFIQLSEDGSKTEILLNSPVISQPKDNVLQIECDADNGAKITMVFYENKFEIISDKFFEWALELTAAPEKELPFSSIGEKEIKAIWSGFNYTITCNEGTIKAATKTDTYILRLMPINNKLVINCSNNK